MRKTLADRMQEFCEYHRDGDGECNAILLREYADSKDMNKQDRFDLAYLFSITYCCESGIILYNEREKLINGEITAAEIKPVIIFQSDRKYVKMRDCFAKLIAQFPVVRKRSTEGWFKGGVLQLDIAIKDVENWYMFGRFSAFLFLETYATLLGAVVTNITINWKNGDTATSGLLNLFGDDEYANEFDRSGVLLVPIEKMDSRLQKVVIEVGRKGGDTNVTKIETSLCAYRKLYKGTRYNGYYLDRMLEELVWYQGKENYRVITQKLFSLRKRMFPHDMLGELHGWIGIRKENKKLYMEYGII